MKPGRLTNPGDFFGSTLAPVNIDGWRTEMQRDWELSWLCARVSESQEVGTNREPFTIFRYRPEDRNIPELKKKKRKNNPITNTKADLHWKNNRYQLQTVNPEPGSGESHPRGVRPQTETAVTVCPCTRPSVIKWLCFMLGLGMTPEPVPFPDGDQQMQL